MKFFPSLDVIARIPLLPVMLWQGMGVRRRAILLPEAAGPREGRAGQGPELRVLIVGDSSAAGVGADHQEQGMSGQIAGALTRQFDVSWRLIARTGATSKSTLKMLAQDREGLQDRFDVAVLVLGVNDAVRLSRLGPWRARQRRLRQVLRDDFGVTSIIVTCVPPVRDIPALPPLLKWMLGSHAERMNEVLERDLADSLSAFYLDFDVSLDSEMMAIDGYHPNETSYTICGEKIADRIIQARKRPLPDDSDAN